MIVNPETTAVSEVKKGAESSARARIDLLRVKLRKVLMID
jgi:hypothetical protein